MNLPFEEISDIIIGPAKLGFGFGTLEMGEICILVKNHIGPLYHDPFFMQGEAAEVFLMEIKKWISSRPDAENRVEHWECIGDDGTWSFDRQERFLEARRGHDQ